MSMRGRKFYPTITQSFLNQVKLYPNREIFHYKETTKWISVSWKEFYDQVELIALGLIEQGVAPGSKVGLISNTRFEWALCDMAILAAQCITVPVYPSNTPDETAYILNHSDCEIVFVEDQKQLDKLLLVLEKLPKIKKIIPFAFFGSKEMSAYKGLISLSALRELGSRILPKKNGVIENNLLLIAPEDVFTICYTSGTTGVPKGVVLTFDSLASVIEDVDHVLGQYAGDTDVLLSFLPISHIFGKVESMAVYHFGWKVYYAESIEKILYNLAEVQPTLLFAVPRIFEKMFAKIMSSLDQFAPSQKKVFDWAIQVGRDFYFPKVNLSLIEKIKNQTQFLLAQKLVFNKICLKFGGRLKLCLAGGAPLPKDIGEFMRIVGIHILEGYGITETCAPVTINHPNNTQYGTVGAPLPEVSVKIAEDGEILLKSRKVFREYFKDPEATHSVLTPDRWFHTGDIGILDDQGILKITDRKKDLIITSAGKNIAPQKIEGLAKIHKQINQFVVFGDKRHYLSALIVLDKEEMVKFARDNNILFSEYAELIKNPKILNLAQGLLDEVNSKLASFETIKKFKLLPNEFSIESGELTPSLKVRRSFLNQKYKAEIDAMYVDTDSRNDL